MTFLAPWALALGIAGAVGALLLHLVARQRPASYLLPTARFVPGRDTLVSRATSRPTELLLLAIRMLLLVAAGAAFARPVIRTARAPRAMIVLLDRSSAVSSDAAAMARARDAAGSGSGVATNALVIVFDSAAHTPRPISALDSLPARDTTSRMIGSLSAALIAARRAAPALARVADSVELVLVSPVTTSELDAATDSIRAEWPGTIRVVRVAASASPPTPAFARGVSLDDPLGPSLASVPVKAGSMAVWLTRNALSTGDSARARAGGTVVRWDSTAAAALHAEGLALGDDVIVAQLGRRMLSANGIVRARWADGAPASREWTLGAGCLREVGVALPAAGDLPLRPGFQRIARGLLAPCGSVSAGAPADSVRLSRLAGSGKLAASSALGEADRPSPFVPWLLGVALLCAVADPLVRRAGARAGVEA